MDAVSEYVRKESSEINQPLDQSDSFLDDPHLQPIEGGYYQCTLCSATLPGQYHVQMHVQGKTHKRRVSFYSPSFTEAGYNQQYISQFFDGDVELSFGVIGKECAPAHSGQELVCELCQTTLYGWDQWHSHFVGKKHLKARRNCPHLLMWQRLDADYPYYYEHISGVWQMNPPKQGHQLKQGKVVVLPPHPDHHRSI